MLIKIFKILTYSRISRITLLVFSLLVLIGSEEAMARRRQVPPGRACPGVPAPSGLIRDEWMRLGGPNGPMGCPVTGVRSYPDGSENVAFENGEISWSPRQGGILGAYLQGDKIVVDWRVFGFHYDKFLVRWNFNGQHVDDRDQVDLWERRGRAFETARRLPEHDTHLRDRGAYILQPNHGYGVYDITIEGCDMIHDIGPVFHPECRQQWMHPVRLLYSDFSPRRWEAPGRIDFRGIGPASSVQDAKAKLEDRLAQVLLNKACQFLGHTAYHDDFDYRMVLLAKMAYADYWDSDRCPGREIDNRAEATEALSRLPADFVPGTDSAPWRDGDYDVMLMTLIPIIYRYQQALPLQVRDHIINDLLTVRGPFNPDDRWPVFHDPILGIGSPRIVPESENHVLMIETARYLTNQILFARTGNVNYDNSRNGMDSWMLNHLQQFLRFDFIEYNSRPYQNYSAAALQNLYSYADNPRVKTAAQMVLDYISAKVAVSSNDARRAAPFRRLVSHDDDENDGKNFLGREADPQTSRMMMLAGITDILDTLREEDRRWAPFDFAEEMQVAALSEYRVPDLILDLLINRSHRRFYHKFQHYANELYASSPSYLISAGGHAAAYAYTVDLTRLPIPPVLLAFLQSFVELGRKEDRGLALPTTLMPTGRFTSRNDLIRFDGDADPEKRHNMCVAPDFACGRNLVIPPQALERNCGFDNTNPPWTFICQSSPPYGYYLAIYQGSGFGFFEAIDTKLMSDTWIQPLTLQQFKEGVLQRNGTTAFSAGGRNTYIMTSGARIEFTAAPDSKILSTPPPSGSLVYGTIISSDGRSGLIRIQNPYTRGELVLDYKDPLNPVRIISGEEPPHGTIYVNSSYSGPERGTRLQPFRTITAAYNAAQVGDWIMIQSGYYPETPALGFGPFKGVTLVSNDGDVIIGRRLP